MTTKPKTPQPEIKIAVDDQMTPALQQLILSNRRKTPAMERIEKRFGGTHICFVIKEAIETTGSQREAAKMLKIHEAALANWMPRLRMKIRPVVEIEGLS